MEINSLNISVGAILDRVYPIGSIYMSVVDMNPSELFGFGEWEKWGEGKTIVGNITVPEENQGIRFSGIEEEGGSETATIAAHAHTINSHTHTVDAHTHGVAAHTHTINAHSHTTSNKAAFATGGPSTNTSGSTAITVAQMPAHQHKGYYQQKAFSAGGGANGWFRDGGASVSGGYTVTATGGGQGHTHTLSSHTHTVPQHGHGNTGTTGLTTNGTALTTGGTALTTKGTTLTTNNGGQAIISTIQPYITCCLWKRIA